MGYRASTVARAARADASLRLGPGTVLLAGQGECVTLLRAAFRDMSDLCDGFLDMSSQTRQGLQFLVQFKWYDPLTLCDLLARYAEVCGR